MSIFDPTAQLPEGFAKALTQDPAALDTFGRLPGQEKAHYVERAHQASTRAEMHALVSELGQPYTF